MEVTKKQLRAWVVEALKETKGVRVALRPIDVKFDEGKAVVLLNQDAHNGFSVGDLCVRRDIYVTWGVECAHGHYFELIPGRAYWIAAFVEITAYPKGSRGFRIKDTFCILAQTLGHFSLPYHEMILREGASVLLFWPEGLKKFGEKEQ